MTHPSIHQTELAAALFDLVGGPVPHPYEQEEEARALAKQLGIPPHQATHILQGMVARGELELVGKRYRLPESAPKEIP